MKSRTRQYFWPLLTGLCSLSLAVNTSGAEDEQSVAGAMPDLEFLEFLGSFETDAGEWIDPGSLMAEEFTGFLDAAASMAPAAEEIETNFDDEQQDN